MESRLRHALPLLLAFAAAPAAALTYTDEAFTCPIGGEKFTQRVMSSGTQAGIYLDTRPYGAIAAPAPLPTCPGNGLVLFKPAFTAQEIATLTSYLASAEYQRARATETPYYRAALLMQRTGQADADIARMLLNATWEADAATYPRYAQATIAAYRRALAAPELDGREALTWNLLIGELLRRSGRFEEAARQFAAIKEEADDYPGILVHVARYQIELVQRRDAAPHLAPDEDGNRPDDGMPLMPSPAH